MNKNACRCSWAVVFLFLCLAGLTRFYHLDWSFWGDEITSFREAKSLFEKPYFGSDLGVGDRVIRAQPLGYLLQALTYKFFGKSETGARIGVATAGTLAIPLIVFLSVRLYGQLTGIILGILLVLSPWHLFHSQNNRVYSYAFLFGSLALLSAALAWKRNSMKWALLAGALSALSVATYAFTILILVGVLAFAVFEFFRRKTPLPWRAVLGYAIFGVPLLLFGGYLAWLGLRHWAVKQAWGYTTVHTLMGLAFNLNWGISLVACSGWIWAWFSKDAADRIWACVAVIAFLFAVLGPFCFPFRHDYIFQ